MGSHLGENCHEVKENQVNQNEGNAGFLCIPAAGHAVFCAVCAGSHGNGRSYQFFRYNMKGMTFTGLSNYMTMFADPVWQKSLVNTLLLVVGSVPITVLFALFVAAMTYEKNPFTDPSSDVCSSCLWLRVL